MARALTGQRQRPYRMTSVEVGSAPMPAATCIPPRPMNHRPSSPGQPPGRRPSHGSTCGDQETRASSGSRRPARWTLARPVVLARGGGPPGTRPAMGPMFFDEVLACLPNDVTLPKQAAQVCYKRSVLKSPKKVTVSTNVPIGSWRLARIVEEYF